MPDRFLEYGVFVNCPFDESYRSIFEAIVFAIHDCGYVARCSLEVSDASQVRIEKIAAIIVPANSAFTIFRELRGCEEMWRGLQSASAG